MPELRCWILNSELMNHGLHGFYGLKDIMMAKGVLTAFGMSDEKIAAAEKSWLEKK